MTRLLTKFAGFVLLFASTVFLVSCGGGNGTPAPANACATATALVLPTLVAPNGTVGVPYTFTSQAVTGGIPPYTATLSAGALPGGLTATMGTNTVTISGTPTAAGAFTGTVQVKDNCNQTVTGQTTITIAVALIVLPAVAPPDATVNQAYSYTSQPITGGTAPFTASITAGALPAGLALGVNGGNAITIAGTPTTVGTSTFTIQVKDSTNPQQVVTTAQITMKVVNLKITSAFLADAVNGQGGYSGNLTATGGTQPYTWSVAGGALPTGLGLNPNTGLISGTPTVTGPVTVSIKLTDNVGANTTANVLLNVLPELPRVHLDTTLPAPGVGSPINLAGGVGLQVALDGAPCGSIIRLHAGDTWTGNFRFPRRSPECTASTPIIITTDDSTLPAPGTRVTPADAPKMPKILTSLINNPALDFSSRNGNPGGSFFRIVGVEISLSGTALTTSFDSALVNVGFDEATTALMPHDIIIDRCYIHGVASTGEVRRGVLMNAMNAAVIDSNISEIHQSGSDSQAIAGWNGPGPFLIQNNRLEASSENLAFGGAIGPNNGGDTVIADVEIRNNYLVKPLSWQQPDAISGKSWLVKNLLEFKNGLRVLIDGNVLENSWASGQVGYAILLTPRGPASRQAGPSDIVAEVTIRNNLLLHVGGGFNIAGDDSQELPGGPLRAKNIALLNNVILDANHANLSQNPFGAGANANAAVVQLLDGVPNVTIDHLTGFASTTFLVTSISAGTTPPNRMNTPSVIRNNVFQHGSFGLFCGGFGLAASALTNCFDDPATPAPDYTLVDNLIFSLQNGVGPNSFPASNLTCDATGSTCYPLDASAAGITDPSNCNAGNFDFMACILTKYKNAGTDGKDLGADMSRIAASPSTNPVKP